VNLLGDNIYNIKKNTETLIDAGKEVGLEINVEKTKYMLLCRHKNVGRNRDIKILLVVKAEGKRPLGRPRLRWVDNIRMDLGEVGWGDVDWIGLAKERNRWRAVVNSVLNLRVPWNAGKLSSGLISSNLSSSAQLHRVS
jgi:hypothetical protein